MLALIGTALLWLRQKATGSASFAIIGAVAIIVPAIAGGLIWLHHDGGVDAVARVERQLTTSRLKQVAIRHLRERKSEQKAAAAAEEYEAQLRLAGDTNRRLAELLADIKANPKCYPKAIAKELNR